MKQVTFDTIESYPPPAPSPKAGALDVDIAALEAGLRAGGVAFVAIDPTKRNQSRVRAKLQWKGLRTIIRQEPDGLRIWANGPVAHMPDSSEVPK